MILGFFVELLNIFLLEKHQNNIMRRLFNLLLLLVAPFIALFNLVGVAYAEGHVGCPERYVTLVNPVRGRELWLDKSLKPIIEQYNASAAFSFPATWLMQYDALNDRELIDTVKNFEVGGEKGVFLEISESLADEAGVVYDSETKWSNPGVIFLSAYTQSERRALIDTIYKKFKDNFGYYSKSVGAWWIDSYSVNYIRQKYGVDAILIVADQKTTDSYGVWGQWWGEPYYPSKYNILTPGVKNKLDAVIIQWAQRDPTLAYGEGSIYSNYSLQANDYIRSGKSTDYFQSLVDSYLDCKNPVGQITIGMETGMEEIDFHSEYINQLKTLSKYEGLNFLTMSDFAKVYKNITRENPSSVAIGGWTMNTKERSNRNLGDRVRYNEKIPFSDYFVADKSSFLDRDLSLLEVREYKSTIPWYLLISLALLTIALRKKMFVVWTTSMLFTFISFFLIFRSGTFHGWQVFYGPILENLDKVQCLLVLSVFAIFYLVTKTKLKNKSLFFWLLPLSFGLDRILMSLRYSVIEGGRVFGYLVDRTRIFGLMIGDNNIKFFNNIFTTTEVASFLRIPFERVWQGGVLYFILYPLSHILLGIGLYFLLIKLSKRIRIIILTILVILFVAQIVWIFKIDPSWVQPITN